MADRIAHRARWAETVQAWKRSGLTQRAFAERENVALGALRAWCIRLGAAPRSQRGPVASPGARFVEVRTAVASVQTDLELHIAPGLFLRFGTDVAPGFVGAVIAAVQGRRC